jgi:hypothetical protein
MNAPKIDEKFNELYSFYRPCFLDERTVLHLMKSETKRVLKELERLKTNKTENLLKTRIKFYELLHTYIEIYEGKNAN